MQLTRTQFKNIKHMSRQEMSVYFNNVFIEGYNSGISTMSSVVSERVDAGIRATKGIGEKRYTELMENIQKSINGQLDANTTEESGEVSE